MTRPTARRVRPIHACSLLLGFAAALPPIVTPLAASAQATGAMTPTQRAAALAGAQGAVARLRKAKSLPEAGDVVTDRSAGELGLLITMIVGMMTGLGSKADGSKATAPHAPTALKSGYDALSTRYGLDSLKFDAHGPIPPPAVRRNGRQFLRDTAAMVGKNTDKADQSTSLSPFMDMVHLPSDITYQVISRSVVRLTPKPQPGGPVQPPMRAVQEADGQWRIDLGDLRGPMSGGDAAPPSESPLEKSFLAAIRVGDLKTVQTMLAQHPALAQAHDSSGASALDAAVFADNVPMVNALLTAGADVNARQTSGDTPLDGALFFHQDDPALLALLRQHGAKTGSRKQ